MKSKTKFILTVMMLLCLTFMVGCAADDEDESRYTVDEDEVRKIAEPILEKMKTESPVYIENFSNNSKGWFINTEESHGYTAHVSVEGTYNLNIYTRQLGADFPNSPVLSDFVLRYDLIYNSGGKDSSCYIIYRNQELLHPGNNNSYGFELYYDSLLRLYKDIIGNEGDGTIRDIDMEDIDLCKMNTYTIIVKDNTHIVCVNDEFAGMYEDDSLCDSGTFHFGVFPSNDMNVTSVSFDNVKIWDIEEW